MIEAALGAVSELATAVAAEAVAESASEITVDAITSASIESVAGGTELLSGASETTALSFSESAIEISGLNEMTESVSMIQNEVAFGDIQQSVENLSESGVMEINTINSAYEGAVHPETGVPFESKVVTNGEGLSVEGVFPDFSEYIKFESFLPEEMYFDTDSVQFEYCDSQLSEAFNNGSLDMSDFSESQKEQINNGDKPRGFTWHHNEEVGRMQLVPSDVHASTGHTGGRFIWGGGTLNR
jgi:hypothetical protein